MSKTQTNFTGKLAVQQRVLPSYRVPFFEELASLCEGGMSLFAGKPRLVEAIQTADALQGARLVAAENWHLLNGPLYLCYQPGITAWLQAEQPDALVVEANSRYPSTPKAVRWMQARQRPVLGWGLGAPPISGPLAGLRTQARQRFLLSLDGVIAYSERGAEEYRLMGVPAGRVFVAHNAAVSRPTSPPERRPRGHAKPVVLFVGRLQARKRLDMLFSACAALPAEQQPDLIIVGDGPAREAFETQAQAIYPAAQFVGAKHDADLAPYFAMADLFVLPGTGGLAVQQAMANGLPVIVAQGDGTQEDLVRPENGWLIEPDHQPSLNESLAQALSDMQRLQTMGQESYRISLQEINLQQMAIKFIQAVNAVQWMLKNP